MDLIRLDLEDIFPPIEQQEQEDKEGESGSVLERQLAMAREVVLYLEDLLPEVQKVASGPLKRSARLDVLGVALLEVNRFLALRLSGLIDTSQMSNKESLVLGDLHGMVAWLTDYKLVLSDIYCPPLSPALSDTLSQSGSLSLHQASSSDTSLSPSFFPLFAFIPELCQWYVEGVPTGCEGATKHIKEHVAKVKRKIPTVAFFFPARISCILLHSRKNLCLFLFTYTDLR